jgi:hypothetical protein
MLMAVMVPREKWTDERLDDLNKKVDKGFEEMREGFARVDGEIKGIRREMKVEMTDLRREMKVEMTDLRREMKGGFEGLYRLLVSGAVVTIAGLIGVIATLVGVSAF